MDEAGEKRERFSVYGSADGVNWWRWERPDVSMAQNVYVDSREQSHDGFLRQRRSTTCRSQHVSDNPWDTSHFTSSDCAWHSPGRIIELRHSPTPCPEQEGAARERFVPLDGQARHVADNQRKLLALCHQKRNSVEPVPHTAE